MMKECKSCSNRFICTGMFKYNCIKKDHDCYVKEGSVGSKYVEHDWKRTEMGWPLCPVCNRSSVNFTEYCPHCGVKMR